MCGIFVTAAQDDSDKKDGGTFSKERCLAESTTAQLRFRKMLGQKQVIKAGCDEERGKMAVIMEFTC